MTAERRLEWRLNVEMTEDPPLPLREIPELSRQTYVNIHSFQALNAISYTIALGSPLTLFARELGASASVLGLIVAFTPLLAMLQLIVAPYAARVGYRPVVMRGWTGRVSTLVLMCGLPWLAPLVSREVSIIAIVASMFVFNLLRGYAAGSWLPWMTALIPRGSRARFLTRDRTFTALSSVAALGVSGSILAGEHTALGYSVMFGLSFLAGGASLYFLNRIPRSPYVAGPTGQAIKPAVPWRTILRDRGFMTYAGFGFGVQLIAAAAGTFVIVFVREEIGLADGLILQLAAIGQGVSMLALWYGRRRLDLRGSKPFIALALGWLVFYFVMWLAMAGRIIPGALIVAPILMAAHGFGAGLLDLASTRMLMNMGGDRSGSSQYFSIYQAGSNLASGLAPLMWGLALDGMRGGAMNRYFVFFGAEIALVLIMALVLTRVRER